MLNGLPPPAQQQQQGAESSARNNAGAESHRLRETLARMVSSSLLGPLVGSGGQRQRQQQQLDSSRGQNDRICSPRARLTASYSQTAGAVFGASGGDRTRGRASLWRRPRAQAARQRRSTARRGGLDERRFTHRRLYVTYTTPRQRAKYLMVDFNDVATLHQWLLGLDSLIRCYVDIIECRVTRPSMMPWMRAVFTSVVESERKAKGRLKSVQTVSNVISIGARSLPSVFAAANLSVKREEAAMFLRPIVEARNVARRQLLAARRTRGAIPSAAAAGVAMGPPRRRMTRCRRCRSHR